MTASTILVILILISTAGQITFKYAAHHQLRLTVYRWRVNPLFLLAIAIYAIVPFIINSSFNYYPLKEVQAFMALNYCLVSLLAWKLFDEKLGLKKVFGILLISAGVYIFNS